MHLYEHREAIEELRGVGPVLRRRLERLGIRTFEQLLCYYPNRYQDRRHKDSLRDADASNPVNVLVRVRSRAWIGRSYKKTLKVVVEDEGTQGALLCFGRGYLSGILQPGKWFWVWGRFQRRRGVLQSTDFEIEAYQAGQERPEYARIIPIYPLTEGLTQNAIRQLVRRALRVVQPDLEEELPPVLRKRRNCLSKGEALRAVHFPESMEQLDRARKTLAYEELLQYQLSLGRIRLQRVSVRRFRTPPRGALKQALLDRLPFELTADQLRVLGEIEADLFAPHPGARLLQGEVGSGKTLVALAAALSVVEAGEQAALMVPTELLARQHGDNAARLLEPLGVRVAILSGSVQGAPRRLLLEGLRAGEIDLLIGTHALFSEEVLYGHLGLVIVDEQQRFGVAQRQALLAKGEHPDLLLMSATPIPRTLALSAFGQLDVSEIRTLPRGRKAVITHLTRQGNEAKVYERVRREIGRGGQAYFVYPLIEESSTLELKDAERMFQSLRRGVFADFHLALIHSRLEEARKVRVMQEFAAGRIDILVATSVLEVGVDVPRAACMVVEHAERFGLSNLHQLRGRVGRGERQSYAFLIYAKNLTESAVARLKAIMSSTDGFRIAEEDLKIRGPGEFLGQKQSGLLRFTAADLLADWDLFLLAREDAREILARDAELLGPSHRALRELLTQRGVLG
jgi:ATP-dependent DNA helicase RecG